VSDPGSTAKPPEGKRRRKKLGRPVTLDRDAALNAAHDVIAERGFDRARYADVAKASGIPVTTLQHAFGSLQAMLLESMQRSTASEIAILRGFSDDISLTPWNRLALFISGAIQHTDDSKFWRLWTEFYALAGRDPEIGRYAGELYAQWWEYLAELVQLGIDSGDFTGPMTDDPYKAAIAIDAFIDGLAVTLILRADGPDFDLTREIALKSIAAMLGYKGPM
jgi:AcrR family transcriptional regulator